MKYIFRIVWLFFLTNSIQLYGQLISEPLARKVAINYHYRVDQFEKDVERNKAYDLGRKVDDNNYLSDTTIIYTYTEKFNGHNSFYVYSFKNGGFVIISGHKSKGPILVHSAFGDFNPLNLPPAMRFILDEFDTIMDNSIKNNISDNNKILEWEDLGNEKLNIVQRQIANNRKSLNMSSGINDHLLNTTWAQGCYYNNNLPEIGNCYSYCSKCPVGCSAVALGQIMNYWKYARGSNADFNWWDINSQTLNYYSDPLEKEAVAYLLERTGNAMNMSYCPWGSYAPLCQSSASTENVEQALNHFGYEYIRKFKSWLISYEQWIASIAGAISSGYPVYYGITNDDDDDDNHSFVLEGYDPSNGNFYMNLGWADFPTCWLDLEDLTYRGDTFSEINKHVAIFIFPNQPEQYLFNTNITIAEGSNYTYQAKNDILTSSNGKVFNVENNSKCRFIAGNTIVLNSGFHALSGSTFMAKIYPQEQLKKSFSEENINENKNLIFKAENQQTELIVYPNPNNGLFHLGIKNASYPIVVSIANMKGQIIKQVTVSNNLIDFDISEESKGLYFIKILTGNNIMTSTKIILE